AQKINHNYKTDALKIPEGFVQKNTALIPGLDGRKMSKSYNNTIPAFCEPNQLRKIVMKIKTDSSPPEAPKNPDESLIFTLYQHFASPAQVEELRTRYQKGIGWGEAKLALYEVLEDHLKGPRDVYKSLMADKSQLDSILTEGSEKAREIARGVLGRVRK